MYICTSLKTQLYTPHLDTIKIKSENVYIWFSMGIGPIYSVLLYCVISDLAARCVGVSKVPPVL